MNKLPKKVQEEIEILTKMYEKTSPYDNSLRAMILCELKGYLRALEHTGLITKDKKLDIIRDLK